VRVAVAEARRRHLVFSPVRGLYVLIPPQYRHEGTVPADWFLDDLCWNYYLGYLSAAARHGAAHQAGQVTQTVVDRSVIDDHGDDEDTDGVLELVHRGHLANGLERR
jgi:hypothetical protein